MWESPKSEGINKGVEANFNLKLAFSIDGKTTETNPPSGSPGDTTTESSPSQPPSTPTPSQPSSGTTPGDTSQSSPDSSTQGATTKMEIHQVRYKSPAGKWANKGAKQIKY